MILHLNKEKIDNLDLDIIGNEFVEGNGHCLKCFGKLNDHESCTITTATYYFNNIL